MTVYTEAKAQMRRYHASRECPMIHAAKQLVVHADATAMRAGGWHECPYCCPLPACCSNRLHGEYAPLRLGAPLEED